MRQLYAEARAAREAAPGQGRSRISDVKPPLAEPLASSPSRIDWRTVPVPVPEPVARARPAIDGWTVQLAKKGERCISPIPARNAAMEKRQ